VSGEIESLLFALQAAIGAGIIGYWLGAAVTREKMRQAAERHECSDRAD
jgi:cobalt/nickel transport protein